MNQRNSFLLLIACFVVLASNAQLEADESPSDYWQQSIAKEVAGDFDTALELMAKFQAAGGNHYMLELRSGWLIYLQKDYAKAIEHYQAAAKIKPKAVTPLLGVANCHLATNQNDNAARAYAQVLEREPNNYTANMVLGGMRFAKGDYVNAGNYYFRVEAIYPEDLGAASGAAWCHYMLGKPNLAVPLFSRVLSVNPNFPNAAEGLKLAKNPPGAPR